MVYRMTVTPMLEEYGRDLRLSPSGILKIFENAGNRHSAAVGDSVSDCLARGEAWLLTDWYVEIYTRIPIGLRVRVETFCHKSTRTVGMLRDFRMKDEAGNLIALSTSKWAKVDVATKRLRRLDDEVFARYGALSRSLFGEIALPPRRGVLPVDARVPICLRRGDFDLHAHVHNLVYLEYAFEAIPRTVYNAHAVRAFHIRYVRPITVGEAVTAGCAETETGYAVYIEANGALAAIVELFTELPARE